MDIDRATRIANSFVGSVSLNVCQYRYGLLVQYRRRSCYFICESSFWAYIFTLAGVPLDSRLTPWTRLQPTWDDGSITHLQEHALHITAGRLAMARFVGKG